MPFPVNAVERAIQTSLNDAAVTPELLRELARARLWVPVAGEAHDDAAPSLTAIDHDGLRFVPVYTSTEQLAAAVPDAACATAAGFHLARLLPEGYGIAVNPGGSGQVPIYPEGVTVLADAQVPPEAVPDVAVPAGDGVTVRSPASDTRPLREAVAAILPEMPAVRTAADGWAETDVGEVLVIAVTLDEPDDAAAQDAASAAVEQAVGTVGPSFAVDVVFPGAPGEEEPGGICGAEDCCGGGCGTGTSVEDWIAANREPFYHRV